MAKIVFNAKITVEGNRIRSSDDAADELSFLLEEYGYFKTARAESISMELENNGNQWRM